MAKIRITDLRLRTIIGANDWERNNKQDIIINITIDYDAKRSSQTDKLKDTLDYKGITKSIVKMAETSDYFLLEKLADSILNIILEHPLAKQVTVRVDKPAALRFADSVSVELSKEK